MPSNDYAVIINFIEENKLLLTNPKALKVFDYALEPLKIIAAEWRKYRAEGIN